MNNLIFSQLNLSKEVLKAIQEMGFEETTPIQSPVDSAYICRKGRYRSSADRHR
jgi:superfamily II DNA/RNA helicase